MTTGELTSCPCGSGLSYEECCGVFHSGRGNAPTAEALMRSRYSAYVAGEIEYLLKTLTLLDRKSFDRRAAKQWSESVQWLGLEILSAKGSEEDTHGRVEFIARFSHDGHELQHHEISKFKKINGRWYFMDGKVINDDPTPPVQPEISRNAPCPCGSGKKFKKCCGEGA